MTATTLARAAARLTPQMAGYQVKRQLRNRTVPRASGAYQASLGRTAAQLPLPVQVDRLPPALVDLVGRFYREDDRVLEEAARGCFTFFDRTVDFGSRAAIDWTHVLPEEADHHLWRMKLTQLEVTHSLLASGRPELHDAAAELLDSLVGERRFDSPVAFQTTWAPYGISHRLLALLSGMAVARQGAGLDPALLDRLADHARFDAAVLWRNLEHDLRNNHTERNLAALCLFHLASGAVTAAQAQRLDRDVSRLVTATVLEDGTQVERSAMYQGLTVMALRVFAATEFLSPGTRGLAEERGAAAEAAWLFLSHADGELALFNDSWAGEVPSPREVVDRDVPLALPQGGYLRSRAGDVSVLMDAGAIGPGWNPGHGHADFLAVEIDMGLERVVVDPGTSQYSTGERRSFERSAASHNGPRFVDLEPVEYRGCFKVGRLTAARPLDAEEMTGLPEDTIGGVLDLGGPRVARVVVPHGDGVLVVDRWGGSSLDAAVRFLLPHAWVPSSGDPRRLEREGGEDRAAIVVRLGEVTGTGPAQWCRRYMNPEPAHEVVVAPETGEGGGRASALWFGSGRPEDDTAVLRTALDRLREVVDERPAAATPRKRRRGSIRAQRNA